MTAKPSRKQVCLFWLSGALLSTPIFLYWRRLDGYDFVDGLYGEYELAWQIGLSFALVLLWIQWLLWSGYLLAIRRLHPAALPLVVLWAAAQGVALFWVASSFANGHYEADRVTHWKYWP